MAYKKNWVPSPNYTPGPQTQAVYGRPRSISGGAGHWWNWPRAGASHDGVVSYMANAARRAAPHAVLSDGRVTEMVRDSDTAWCTSNANPYTFAIEIDPRIMFKWGQYNPSAAEKALGERIFQTLCEYIADKGYHNLPWKPHKVWAPGTECNPIPYNDVMARAKQIWQQKYGKPAAKPQWQQNLKKWPASRTMYARDNTTPLRNLAAVQQVVKNFAKGTPFEIMAETKVGNYVYYLTRYAYEHGTGQGFDTYELQDSDPNAIPEWQKNIVDTADVKLYVLPAAGTPVINLTTGLAIPESTLPKGTAVDIAKQTTVGGVKYLISSYSASKGLANGIKAADMGALEKPPVVEKPEWLNNLKDIADVTMYTRSEAPLVNLLDGTTIKMLPINTPVEIATATEVHGEDYLLSKYATDNNQPNGMLAIYLDKDPIKEPEEPATPAPEQPSLEERVTLLEQFVAAIKALLAKIGINL